MHLILVIGALPPPINGQSKNLERIAGDIAACPGVRLVRRSVAAGALEKSVVTHARKAGRVVAAWVTMLALSLRYRKRSLYLVADGGRGLVYTWGLAATAKALGYRIVLQHRTFEYVRAPNPLMARIDALRARSAGAQVFLCESMARRFREAYGSAVGPSHVVGNLSQYAGFAGPQDRPEPLVADAPIRVTMLSNLIPEKGVDTFLATARLVLARSQACQFTLAGPVPHADTRAAIEALVAHAPEQVRWLGPLYGEDKRELLKRTDVFVFPTRYRFEAQPNVVLEAMRLGATVVAPDRGCIASDVAETGVVIEAGRESDPKAYAEVLLAYAAEGGRALLNARRQAAFEAAAHGVVVGRAAYAQFLSDLTGVDANRLPVAGEPGSTGRASV
ncbi:MAG: glycosyltransferase family 4 protein [Pseudomonadota bacterium]